MGKKTQRQWGLIKNLYGHAPKLLLAGFFLLYWLKSALFLDPDFGWHVRLGQLILENGIPRTDPFSYTMPGYPFIAHEWLTSVGIYILQNNIGYTGVSAIFAFLATLSLWLLLPKQQTRFIMIPLLLAGMTLFYFVGVRAQVLGWLLFSVLIFVVSNEDRWQKYRLFLPIVILAWANLHGSFALGVAALILVVFVRALQRKRVEAADLLSLSLCILITGVTPYGFTIWREVFNTIADKDIHWRILEWQPVFYFTSLPYWLLVVISVLFVIRHYQRISFAVLALYAVLLLASMTAIRHIPLWLLLAVSITPVSLALFSQDIAKTALAKMRLAKAYFCLIIIATVISLLQLFLDLRFLHRVFTNQLYPHDAVAFLKKNPSSGQIFSEYAWGGFLLWKLPEKKVFIDGRMPVWKNPEAPTLESPDAWVDHSQLLSGKRSFSTAAKKYDIDTVLVGKASSKTVLLQREAFMRQLGENGFRKLYEDKNTIVYRKRQIKH